jgi:DNA-directed RNA polymerase
METFDQRYDRQLELEKQAVELSYDKLMRNISSRIKADQADELTEGRIILLHSIDLVTAKIKEFFGYNGGGLRGSIKKYLADFEDHPKDLAYILLATLVRSVSRDELVPATTMVTRINKAVYDSMAIRRLEDKGDNLDRYVERRFGHRGKRAVLSEKLKIAKHQKLLGESDLTKETVRVGAFLIELVIASGCGVIEKKSVYHKRGKTRVIIKYTDECYKMILQSRELLMGDYKKYPIHIIPPKPWEDFEGSGGYHTTDVYKMQAIKAQTSSRKHLKEYFKKTNNTHLFDVLNTLQNTPWRVNRRVFDVAFSIFNNNIVDPEAPSNNPKLVGGLPYNGTLLAEDFVNMADYGELEKGNKGFQMFKDKKKGREYYKALEAQNDLIQASNSKAMMANLVFQNALEYVDEEEIYFSYQYDFRGRIYPIQQHLQPQGTDHIKALLEFKNGCNIVTEDDLYWFLIHGANCFGYDKDDYDERVRKIKERTDEIKAIAEDPMANRNYWKDADSPFLYLAWCFEYADYLADPSGFISRIPIALDATCSGIQIYSGLLRDKDGARAVNVIGDTREDIYQRVADKVNEYLNKGDYPKLIKYTQSDGTHHEVSTKPIADSLKGKVNRKLTKRNTMTQPYSVTTQGMRDQLRAELDEMENHGNRFWVGENWLVAMFLADMNTKAIEAVVKGARVGQQYLIDVTSDLARKGKYVFYHAPLTGFPVLQKLHLTDIDRIETPIGKLHIKRTIEDSINVRKMKSGIAPNFVHSLDAALLAETVLKLKFMGCKNFHLIHDSYGVPVNFVTELNEAVREAFVELFEADPLTNWYYEVNPHYEIPPQDVMIDTLDLDDVRKARYIFS